MTGDQAKQRFRLPVCICLGEPSADQRGVTVQLLQFTDGGISYRFSQQELGAVTEFGLSNCSWAVLDGRRLRQLRPSKWAMSPSIRSRPVTRRRLCFLQERQQLRRLAQRRQAAAMSVRSTSGGAADPAQHATG